MSDSQADQPSPKAPPPEPTHAPLRLEIDPVIDAALAISVEIAAKLPEHPGLQRTSREVAEAALEAKQVSQRLRRRLGWHRAPAIFLVLALSLLALWVYWQYLHAAKLVVAVSARDAVQLKQRLGRRVRVVPRETIGSQNSIALLKSGKADVAFIQGGVAFPDSFPRLQLAQGEVVLFYARPRVDSLQDVRTVLTSSENQGSHSLAKIFAGTWGIQGQVRYLHDWRTLTDDDEYIIADDVDAVFVVKDPMSLKLRGVSKRLADQGFFLREPDIGAMSLRLEYLTETRLRAGFLDPVAHLPTDDVASYRVATFLVARSGLTHRQLVAAGGLIRDANDFPDDGEPGFAQANEVAQGVEALLGIGIYIGLAFLTLLGWDIVAYRKRFNELNTLVSLISIHQSSKDVVGREPEVRQEHIAYLGYCSDLLGMIAVITGYYAQENSSLLYNRLVEIINDRCNGLKINIQLKILHSVIPMLDSTEEPASD